MHIARRRKFTDQEKRDIVTEAAIRGTNLVLREHNISYSVYYRWKSKFSPAEKNEVEEKDKMLHLIQELSAENNRLKRIVANQALEIEIRNESMNTSDIDKIVK